LKILHKEKQHNILRLLSLTGLIVLLIASLIFPRFLSVSVATFYSSKIFPKIAFLPNSISNMSHVSITENLVVVGSVFLIVLLIVLIIKIVIYAKKRQLWTFLYKLLVKVLIIATLGSVWFQLMHGINYNRRSVKEELGLKSQIYEYEDYVEALYWAYCGMCNARLQLGQDYNGVAHMKGSVEESSLYANLLLNDFSETYDVPLSQNFIRAKAVSLSDYWSQTDIVGMYDVFLGEANVNTGYIDVQRFPVTLCHELCHSKGFASETDCNTLATIVCSTASRADFRYAGFYRIYVSLYNIVYNLSKENGKEMPDFIDRNMMALISNDEQAFNSYWGKIRSGKLYNAISDISEFFNDSFLKANGQTEGTKTYQIPPNVYMDYYMKYVEGNNA